MRKMEAFAKATGRPSSAALLELCDEKSLSSNLLGQAYMNPEDEWPTHQGRPLTALLNVRIDELPYVPLVLKDMAYFTVFLDVDGLVVGEVPFDRGWTLRSYSSLEGLIPKKPPSIQERAKNWAARSIVWCEHLDVLHVHSEIEEGDLFGREWADIREHVDIDTYECGVGSVSRNILTTKLGGFPSYKQYEQGPSHPDHFLFQICFHREGKETDYDLCDLAITYVGFIDGQWKLDTQTN